MLCRLNAPAWQDGPVVTLLFYGLIQVSHLEEDLKQCKKERDEAVLREKKLELKVFDLEVELENVSHSKQDRPRYSKITEVLPVEMI